MTVLLLFLLAICMAGAIWLAVLWIREIRARRRAVADFADLRARVEPHVQKLEKDLEATRAEVARLARWTSVADADDEAQRLRRDALAELANAERDARILLSNAEDRYRERLEEAEREARETLANDRARAREARTSAQDALERATARAAEIVAAAETRAKEIAGKAYDAVQNAETYQKAAAAMKNLIDGYGDRYLRPVESLLDELASDFSHTKAGQELKQARAETQSMINAGMAARCDYVEDSRRAGAERFIIDAFNGKVDSILSRVRHDNAGTLEQEIRDAYSIVNFGGRPFRNARITDDFLEARVRELKWAAVAQELRRAEQEEQRAIKQQIREEERARREYEKAQREATKQEEMLRKALQKARAEFEAASEEERAEYESRLASLAEQLREAEERSQRAKSLAETTKRGHVYIISNTGSFGADVYKIGLTRRLDPLDRVRELGDASVPFAFDVHAMLYSDDAPALEHRLHKHFILHQVNKVNHRKEFFRANLVEIRGEIDKLGISAKWTMTAEAREYRETLAIEAAIENDPAAREQWVTRQFTLELTESNDEEELVAVED